LPRRPRSIVEHVAEMTAAVLAVHFSANHEVAAILSCLDGVGHRCSKAGPPRSAVELRVGGKERLAAAGADEHAAAMFLIERTRSARLGAMTSQDLVLIAGQFLFPLIVGFLDVKVLAGL